MSEIIFIYKGYEISIACSQGEKLKDIMERLSNKINIPKADIYGLYNGKMLDEEMKEDQIKKDENNKKKILIYEYNKSTMVNNIVKSKEVICPICKENCLIIIKDYKITLYGCKQNHKTNITINEFDESQRINISNIKCNICNIKNKGNTYNNEFYICLSCNINICPLCKSSHNNKHNIINYDNKNIICNQHGGDFFGYCKDCKKNICSNCEDDHNNHDIITYGKIIKDKNKIIENNTILKNDINILNNTIKEIINKLNIVINNFELYYEINKNITDNINNKKRNYELLSNIININDNNIHNDIKNIINENDINIQFNNIMKIYNLMKPKDEILIKYLINKDDEKINIFGKILLRIIKINVSIYMKIRNMN